MIRPYDAARDAEDLWALKRAFELGLGSNTGGNEKDALYRGKVTDAYRERYLAWVARCQADEPRCVLVADERSGDAATDGLAGYVFVLPDTMAMIWDAAVLNEIFVPPERRGTGVADDLMAGAVDVAASQDLPLDRLVLDVDRENDRAQAFYARHGFEHWGEMVARPL